MADKNSLLGTLLGGEESEGPWSIEETQLQILEKITGLVTNSRLDTKSLSAISKNIAILAKDTETAEDMKKQLEEMAKYAKDDAKDFKNFRKGEQTRSKLRSTENKGLVDSLTDRAAIDILKPGAGGDGGLGKALGGTAKKLGGFGFSILESDGSLRSLATSAGIFGGVLGTIIGFVGSTIDTFREMSDIGQTFGGNMFQMTIDAGKAGLSLESMTTIVKKHSALAAGTGLKIILDHQKGVRQLSKGYGNFGMSLSELTEFTTEHMEIMKIRGQFDTMSNIQRQQATKDYLMQLTAMSRATGRSRKELLARDKKQTESAGQISAAMMARSRGQGDAFELARKEMMKFTAGMTESEADKAMENFYNATVRGTSMMDKNMQAYVVAGGAVGEAARSLDIAMKNADAEGIAKHGMDLKKALVAMVKGGDSAAISMMQQAGANKEQISAMLENGRQLVASVEEQERINGLTKEQFAEEVRLENEKNKATERALRIDSDFQESIGKIRASLMEGLLPFVEFIADHLPDSFEGLIGVMAGVVAGFVALKIALKLAVTKGAGSLASKIGLGGGGGPGKGMFQKASMAGEGPMGKVGKALGGGPGKGMMRFGAGMKSLGKGVGGIISGILKGIATGIGFFALPSTIAGLAVIAVSIPVFAAAISGAIALLGLGMPILAEGLKAMAESFKKFEELDGDNLINVGLGIGAIGAALIVFAGSKIADAVGSFVSGIAGLFGADSPIEQLEKIAELGPGLMEASMGLTGLSKAFATFGELSEQKSGGLLSMFADTDAEDMAQMLGEQASKVGARRGATTVKSKFLGGADEAERQTSAIEQMTIAFDSSSMAKNSTLIELLDAIQHQNEVLMTIASSNEIAAKFSKEISDKVGRGGRLN